MDSQGFTVTGSENAHVPQAASAVFKLQSFHFSVLDHVPDTSWGKSGRFTWIHKMVVTSDLPWFTKWWSYLSLFSSCLCLAEEAKVVLQTQQGAGKEESSFYPTLHPHAILPLGCWEAGEEANLC